VQIGSKKKETVLIHSKVILFHRDTLFAKLHNMLQRNQI